MAKKHSGYHRASSCQNTRIFYTLPHCTPAAFCGSTLADSTHKKTSLAFILVSDAFSPQHVFSILAPTSCSKALHNLKNWKDPKVTNQAHKPKLNSIQRMKSNAPGVLVFGQPMVRTQSTRHTRLLGIRPKKPSGEKAVKQPARDSLHQFCRLRRPFHILSNFCEGLRKTLF